MQIGLADFVTVTIVISENAGLIWGTLRYRSRIEFVLLAVLTSTIVHKQSVTFILLIGRMSLRCTMVVKTTMRTRMHSPKNYAYRCLVKSRLREIP